MAPEEECSLKEVKRLVRLSAVRTGIAVLLLLLCSTLHADVGLMLNEALRVGASKWTGAGHSAVYLSGVCMSTPVELRLCQKGENGVVLTNYRTFSEDRPYEWNAVPLNVYLYGVEDESARPLYANPTVRWMMQERYREKYLKNLCTGACATNPNALWRETVAATFLRDIYMFKVKTTTEQDRVLIGKFNAAGNVGRYNGFTYNCADFARDVVNLYFPGAAKADRINDFWMTSPKAIAKSFAHYGEKHPEFEFHVLRFSQIPGEYAPSRDNRKGTEELFRANRWRLPLAVLRPYELIMFASSYMATGRFDPEKEMRRRPSGDVTKLQASLRDARAEQDRARVQELLQRIRYARASSLGTNEEWSGYRTALLQYEYEAVEQGCAKDLENLRDVARATVSKSWITMDENGGLWLSARDGSSHPRVGLSASTISEDSSDTKLGYVLALWRVSAESRKEPKNRETLGFFRRDWELMERLRGKAIPILAGSRRAETGGGSAQ